MVAWLCRLTVRHRLRSAGGGLQVEQALQGGGQLLLLILPGEFLEFAGERAGDFLRHAGQHGVQHFVLVSGERSVLLPKGIQFFAADLVQTQTQRYDGGHDMLPYQLAAKALGFGLQNFLRFGSGGFLQMTSVARADNWIGVLARLRAIRDSVEPK